MTSKLTYLGLHHNNVQILLSNSHLFAAYVSAVLPISDTFRYISLIKFRPQDKTTKIDREATNYFYLHFEISVTYFSANIYVDAAMSITLQAILCVSYPCRDLSLVPTFRRIGTYN